MSELELRRQADRRMAEDLLPRLMAQIEWSPEQLAAHRRQTLRELLVHATRHSPFHRDRLAGIDPVRFRIEDLPSLPSMTKDDLMGSFDSVAADPRITRERCEDHIATGDLYMEGEFLVFASGGTSGHRALGVSERAEAARGWSSMLRFLIRWARRREAPTGPPSMVVIGAGPGPHASNVLGRIFGSAPSGSRLSVLDPLDRIVASLNAARPDHLLVYASFVPRLLDEAVAGRLRIRPKLLIPVAEPFLPEHEDAVAEVWGCDAITSWGATETGLLGGGTGFESGMVIYDDFTIVEPVDADGRPVAPGTPAAKLFVTPLYRRALPVVRYELTDQLTVIPEPATCGTSFTRTTHVVGRLDDRFVYPEDVEVHPHVFRTVLGRERGILEYRVLQTASGADIEIVVRRAVDTDVVGRAIALRLKRLGLWEPVVRARVVDRVERPAGAAKLRRFVPLPASR